MAYKLIDSAIFTKAQLDAIVTAFADLANGLQPYDFSAETGESDPAAEQNFKVAKGAVYPGSCGELPPQTDTTPVAKHAARYVWYRDQVRVRLPNPVSAEAFDQIIDDGMGGKYPDEILPVK